MPLLEELQLTCRGLLRVFIVLWRTSCFVRFCFRTRSADQEIPTHVRAFSVRISWTKLRNCSRNSNKWWQFFTNGSKCKDDYILIFLQTDQRKQMSLSGNNNMDTHKEKLLHYLPNTSRIYSLIINVHITFNFFLFWS